MGTRSLTYVYNSDYVPGKFEDALVCMYRQFDGYPEGHGSELAEFLSGREVVNGIGSNTPRKASNGMGCLAASLVGYFKTDIGGIYLHTPVQNQDSWQDYEYHVFEDAVVVKNPSDIIFAGSWEDFEQFCLSPNELETDE